MELREDLTPVRRRAALIVLVALAAVVALDLRLFELQVIDGRRWRQLAENNLLRWIPVAPFRGRIYDRRGRVLADNAPTWRLLIFPDESARPAETAVFLARVGVADLTTIRERLAERRASPLAPIVGGDNLSWSQVAEVRAHRAEYPELSIVSGFRRSYPQGALVAHAIGHLRPLTLTEIEQRPGGDPNALVGASGVERAEEEQLAGRGGERWLVVSAVGERLGVVREAPATPGRDLTVTIDLELQRAAAEAIGAAPGAVVALDPRDGAIRALYSSPSFDPNLFSGHLDREAWSALRDNPAHPLQNRCTQGVYPPGSTIKPFLAVGALADGLVTPRTVVTCRGGVTLYGHFYRCWRRNGHGRVALVRSLEASCDSYYYLLGQRLRIEGIARWLGRFGFGQPATAGLIAEAAGLVGTPEWSRRVRGKPWYPGEAVSVSIGQGPLLATPLQLARAFAALANGGRLVTPHLVPGGAPLESSVDLGLERDDLAAVVDGLRQVVHGREGTARTLGRLPVAGKTGTAQVVRLEEDQRSEDLEEHERHHALFVGWTPLDEPRLVVAVVVEHGGGGGSVAAPIAGRVLARADSARE